MIWSFEPLGYYFGILVKPFEINLILMGLVVVWFFVLRTIWRANIFDRFLGLDEQPDEER